MRNNVHFDLLGEGMPIDFFQKENSQTVKHS